jgi:hypothetical protein
MTQSNFNRVQELGAHAALCSKRLTVLPPKHTYARDANLKSFPRVRTESSRTRNLKLHLYHSIRTKTVTTLTSNNSDKHDKHTTKTQDPELESNQSHNELTHCRALKTAGSLMLGGIPVTVVQVRVELLSASESRTSDSLSSVSEIEM